MDKFSAWHGRAVVSAVVTLSLAIGMVVAAPLVVANSVGRLGGSVNWNVGGYDISNSRHNPNESAISVQNVGGLAVKWTFPTHGDVSATPAVVDGAVYFPDRGGYLNKVNAATGGLIWQRQISSYDGVAGDVSRTAPAIVNGRVYIGGQSGGHLMAIKADTGDLVWSTQIDTQPSALLTQSPIVHDGLVYQGVSSGEAVLAADPAYPCCTFRGSISAVDATTGAIRWKRYTVPENGGRTGGYSGGGVWGGTPVVDPARGTVFTGTGQNYSLPQSVYDCQNTGAPPSRCFSPDNHIDSLLALDLKTGAIKWAAGPADYDTWNLACPTGGTNCPPNPGHDYDFSDGPHLFRIGSREVVGAGAKSGVYTVVDALTGGPVWTAAPGPGSYNGGIMWGSSVDGARVYVAEANAAKLPYMLPDGTTTTSSSWAALDVRTGKVKWQTVDPDGGPAIGAVTTANGVLFGSSLTGDMYAMNAATGKILWHFKGQYSSGAGPALVNGVVYWGNGYSTFGTGSTTSGTFYAFSPGGC